MARRPLPLPTETGFEVRWLLAVGFVELLAVFFSCAGASWNIALYRLLTDGAFLLVWLGACAGLGWAILRKIKMSGMVSAVALGIGAYSLLILGFGLAGILNRPTAWLLMALGIVLGGYSLIQSKLDRQKCAAALRRRVPATDALWLLIVPFLAIALLGAFMPPGFLWGENEPNGYDVVEYHLQIPREWFEMGRIAPLRHNVFSYFPFNVETHYLLAMQLRGAPWAGMYLAQLMHLAMIVLSVMAVYEFAGRKGVLGVMLVAATPWLTLLSSIAYNEGGVLLFGTLAVTWALRGIDQEMRTKSFALAGVFAGFACGVKLTSAPMLLVLIPVAFLVAMGVQKKLSQCLRPLLFFAITGVLLFSPWLLRNFVWSGNPVFPEAMSLLGRGHFSVEQETRWQRAYVPPPGERDLVQRLSAAKNQIFCDWRFGYALFPAAGLAIAGAIRKRGGFSPAVIVMLVLFVAWLVLWIGFTHLQGRFFVLAIPVMGLLIARVEQPIARLVVVCALLLQVGYGLIHLGDAVAQRIRPVAMAGVLGIEDYSPFGEQMKRAKEVSGDVCLVGEAKAFLYQTQPGQLFYRTVFDVDVRGRDIVTAWVEGFPSHPADVVVDAGELGRFHKTYYGIPAPPEREQPHPLGGR